MTRLVTGHWDSTHKIWSSGHWKIQRQISQGPDGARYGWAVLEDDHLVGRASTYLNARQAIAEDRFTQHDKEITNGNG